MKNTIMKINLVLLILFFCASHTFGQTKYKYNYKQGYKFIRKAEKNLQKGKFSKTDKYLKKAMESDYGFCGNAWMDAHEDVVIIKARSLNKQNRFDETLVFLDTVNAGYGLFTQSGDSLKIATLILKYGEDKVKSAFKKIDVVNITSGIIEEPSCWVYVNDLNYKFRFNGDVYSYYNGMYNPNNSQQSKLRFDEIAKGQLFYKLLE